ncbi:MAG: N-acetylmuramidase family protein [Muribaculaceae bacterium]|nr:N-acetylmuramidase family protein [Muribaculaceae bacterium]
MRRMVWLGAAAWVAVAAALVCGAGRCDATSPAPSSPRMHAPLDSVQAQEEPDTRYTGLTDADFRKVADELGVEVAAIRAVVDIEAGKSMKGFWAPGVPVINFDSKMYARFKARKGGGGAADTVPAGLKGYALQEWTQLVKARKSNAEAANLGTFWGMFQIGGFNYSKCGCNSIGEFVDLMSYSELEQLELFAAFITNTGMLPDLKARDWASFSRKYNGASYARKGYHRRMAEAYAKYKKLEKESEAKQ